MNNVQFDDFKQLLETTVFQSELRLRDEMKAGFKAVNDKLDAGFAGVGDVIENVNNVAEQQHANSNRRLTKLEHRPI
jgi:hypothetical protein